jgi:hypothetical protein
VCIADLRLAPGNYSINIGVKSECGEEDFVAEAAVFEVISNEKSAEQFADSLAAACIPQSRFTIENLDEAISLFPISSTL